MKKFLVMIALSIGVCNAAQAAWFFRGTPNNWGATEMVFNTSSSLWETQQTFSGAVNPRFKISRNAADWVEAYPASDYLMANGDGNYKITFNETSKAIVVAQVISANSICFNNPNNFAAPFIYFWAPVPTASVSPLPTWPGLAMTKRGAFYCYDLTPKLVGGVMPTSMGVIFSNNGASQTANLSFSGGLGCQQNGAWKTVQQCGFVAPSVTTPSSSSSSSTPSSSLSSSKLSTSSSIASVSTSSASSSAISSFASSVASSVSCTVNCPSTATTLGAVYSLMSTTFSLWSPDSANVQVKVNGVLTPMVKVLDFNGYQNIYQVKINGDLRLAEYNFVVNNIDVRDPYGKMVKPQSQSNIVMDMSRTALASGWAARPALFEREDSIIYEVHVRDFSIDASSGVTASNRGKYLGMVEAGTTLNGVKTGIDHLKELGVTHVQLLPVYDFASCDGLPDTDACYNWGYDPRNFNVPEERYSQTPTDYENRAREFKTLVNEFHKAGIRVVMDVVYNHSFSKEMFEKITTKYYTPTDLSGTGNSIDADQPMVSRMIQDSLNYWASEYGIDGFRFDLLGIFSFAEVKKWGSSLNTNLPDRNLLIYGEPWNGFAADAKEGLRVRLGTTNKMVNEHVGVFNSAYREAIKGDNDNIGRGYMFNDLSRSDNGWGIYDGHRGSPYNATDNRNGTWFRNYAADPEQTINYISAHDNFALWDKIFLSLSTSVVQTNSHQILSLTPPVDLTYSKRVVNFGMGIVLTSQGIPFIHAGDEFLRSKTNNQNITSAAAWNFGANEGTHNTYNSPDSFNSIKWGNKVSHAATYKYFKDMVSFRRAHPGLRMNTNAEVAQFLSVGRSDDFVGQVVSGHITCPDDVNNIFVVYNSGNNRFITLPAGVWTQVLNTSGATNVSGLSGMAQVEGTAVTVFMRPR